MKSIQVRFLLALFGAIGCHASAAQSRPNIVLVMADDMGWGQTSYNKHPVLKTPNLDAMAANGLRFDRFYAGAPLCSPTRATVLTGRANDRAGVPTHGHALRLQEKTIAQALRSAGYSTGHFGKWHLNGLRGPGVPVLASDERHPGKFGFDEWLSTTNFFDLDPLLSRNGQIEEFEGDSSELIVAEALTFVERQRRSGKPFFAVIWYGTPHSPFRALPADKAAFASLNSSSADHYGELVAMDRSIGTLRQRLRDLGVAENTLLMFCSDNGGLPNIEPKTVGGLRGFKGTVFEGGLRVPAIIEWPAVITSPRITRYPASTMDIFPTVADILGLPRSSFVEPVDGKSLKPLLTRELGSRNRPIPFRYQGKGALVDNRYKLVSQSLAAGQFALFDLETDPKESRDISAAQPAVAERMRRQLLAWNATVDASVAGKDYPEGKVAPADPKPVFWFETARYEPYLLEWRKRWEYEAATKAPAKGEQNNKEPPPSQDTSTVKAKHAPDKVVVFKQTPHGELKAHIYFPPGWSALDRRPAIVFWVGGGFRSGQVGQFNSKAEYFASRGLVSICAEYRGRESHGILLDSCAEDARSAMRWVKSHAAELGISPEKVIASGGSAGGCLSLLVAREQGPDGEGDDTTISPRPSALVLFNPAVGKHVMDVVGWGGPAQVAVNAQIAALDIPEINEPPAIIFFGAKDRRFLNVSREFDRKLRAQGGRCELWVADKMGHGFFNNQPWHDATTRKADEFLISLGYLTGEPTIKENPAAMLTLEK